jgi:hypothetical protein
VAANAPLAAAAYTPDSTDPAVSSFDFSVHPGELKLTFTETVDLGLFNISDIVVQHAGTDADVSYRLTGGNIGSATEGTSVTVTLTPTDLNAIKFNLGLAVDKARTFISYNPTLVPDMAENAITAVADSAATQVDTFTGDDAAPELTEARVDLTAETLTLSFSESVLLSSVDTTKIAVQNVADAPTSVYELTAGVARQTVNTVIVIELDTADLNVLKNVSDLAVDQDSAFIRLLTDAVTDTSGNGLTEMATGRRADAYTADAVAPTLDTFDLDMDAGELRLTFSETVNTSTFIPGRLTLLSVANGSSAGALSHSISVHSVVATDAVDSTIIVVVLNTIDSNPVKNEPALAVSKATSFLAFSAEFILDMNGVGIEGRSSSSALQTTTFTADTTSPRLSTASIDLNGTTMTLNFNEPVGANSVIFPGIAVQNGANGGPSVRLTGGSSTRSSDGLRVTVTLLQDDVDTINADDRLAVNRSTTFITMAENSTRDMAGNGIDEIAASSSHAVSVYVADTIRPRLHSFNLNIDSQELTLVFNETVDISSVDLSKFTLQAASNAVPAQQHQLTGGTIQTATDGTSVTIVLSTADVNQLKLAGIAQSSNSTWLVLDATALTDAAGQDIIPLENGVSAMNVDVFVLDATPPTLLSYDLDMDAGQIHFTFSETVRAVSLDLTRMRLSSGDSSFNLTNSSSGQTTDSSVIVAELSRGDLNELKSREALAVSNTTTYLHVEEGAIADIFGVEIEAVADRPVSRFVPDTTRPSIEGITLNLNDGTISFSFDEVVRVSSLNLALLYLQNTNAMASATAALDISGGSAGDPSAISSEFTASLTSDDLNAIKFATTLGVSVETTFIAITGEHFVDDVNGNSVHPIARTAARPVTQFVADEQAPRLTSVAIDMDRLELGLVFSETINISSFEIVEVTVQNKGTAPSEALTLTGGTASTVNLTNIRVIFSKDDGDELKRLTALATGIDTTFVALSGSAVADMSGNWITGGSVVQASDFTSDATRPTLVAAVLDLSQEVMNLTFSETVNASTFEYTAVTLQSSGDPAATSVTLSTPEAYIVGDTAVSLSISLGDDDLNEIKRNSNLCVSTGTCFVNFVAGMVKDVSGNEVVPAIRAVDAFVADNVAPQLVGFGLLVDASTLMLTFSESVDAGSIDISSLSLSDEAGLISVSFTATSTVNSASKQFVNVTVSGDDMDLFKLNLGASASIFLEVTSSTIRDTNNNELVATRLTTALYEPDSLSPTLTSFSLDLDGGLLELSFDEIMDIDSLRRHLFRLLSEAAEDADEVPLE